MRTLTRSVPRDDPLYGQIEFPEELTLLFDTPEMQRLQEIQISIPTQFLRNPRPCASRFEHSRGVAYLAKVLAEANPEFADTSLELQYAGLVHDVGTPPFSHCSETVMEQKLGKDHEAFGRQILSTSAIERLAMDLGINIDIAAAYGGSPLFNGYPDLDNADNTPRYGTSQGLYKLKYDPVALAAGICSVDGQYCLQQKVGREVVQWAKCRRKIYRWVYSPAHQAPYLMLRRAIELMEMDDQLPLSFFSMTDAEALTCLMKDGGSGTRKLVEAASKGEYYLLAFQHEVMASLAKKINFCKLANDIAVKLKVPFPDVCTGTQDRRGDKHRTLPFVDSQGIVDPLPLNGKPQYMTIDVYVASCHLNRKQEIGEYIQDQLNQTLYALSM